MPSNWNKGKTKLIDFLVKKISDTMKLRKFDNFKVWRDKMKLEGKIKSKYVELKKNGDLAELIGVTLGDGHVCKYLRTEELRIISNLNNPGFVHRYADLVYKVFGKKAYVRASNQSNSIRIGLYEKYIGSCLGIAAGARKDLVIMVPDWILVKKNYIVRYLRGLYEVEGSHSVHVPTCIYKVQFSNSNQSMLENVFTLVSRLGFHPHKSKNMIHLSRKAEVFKFLDVIEFRKY
ncbi:MAG: hypothetical protein NTV02_00465 [Candidatus Zambryskibacteria bacterium]|nr:hypothetical protein [Candidatus Zambryskibacteria bacterium]